MRESTTLMMGEPMPIQEGGMWEVCISTKFFCEPKTSLKNKVYIQLK